MSGPIQLDHMMGRWVTGGSPWHGRVEGGVLTLPNGATMPWPQPDSGAVLLQQRPGFGPGLDKLSIGVEQDAADATAGRQWLNYAMLATGQLYGKTGPDRLWTDINGEVWEVFTNPPTELGGGNLRFPVTLYPWGEFGGSRSVQSYTVDMTDPSWSIDAHFPSLGRGFSGGDTALDGSRWIYTAVARRYPPAKMQPASGIYVAYAFFEISISGAGASASLSAVVLRTNNQCFQVSESSSMVAPDIRLYAVSESVFDDTCHGPDAPGTDFDVTATTQFLWRPPTNVPDWPAQGRVTALGKADLSSGSINRTATQIIDVRYGAGGAHEDVVATVVATTTRDAGESTLPTIGSVVQSATFICGGAGLTASDDSFGVSWTGTQSSNATMTIAVGGAVIASASMSASGSTSVTQSGRVTGPLMAGASVEFESSVFSMSVGVSSSMGGSAGGSRNNEAHTNQNNLNIGLIGLVGAGDEDGFAHTMFGQVTGVVGSPRLYIEAFRWTSYMWGLREHLRTSEAPVWTDPATVLTWRYSAAVGKWGSAPALTTQNAPYQIERRYGTEDPITGAAEIGRANPVAYV